MENEYIEEKKYLRAQKRVKDIRGFYAHFIWFVAINLFFMISKVYRNINNGETFSEAFFDYKAHSIWVLWGIVIVFHWFGVFGSGYTLSKEWEERKIKELMDQDNY